jgi:hypothetical protein
LSKKSLSEAKDSKKIKKDLLFIYEKIYFPEYDKTKNSLEERKELLEKLKQVIKNY